MARPLPSFPMASCSTHLIFVIPISFFFIFSILIFLCASTKKSDKETEEVIIDTESKDVKFVAKLNRKISSKAVAMVKMISWRTVEAAAVEDYETDDDEAVWKKKIMMGERCSPLKFSGKIVYDSDRNLLSKSQRENP
ncbi:hypothetical protein ACFX2I_025493 [Malus domestica]